MSIEAMNWALYVPVGGTAKVVLLGLASHADADGRNAYPSVERLSKYAHADRRTVQRNLRNLLEAGLIEVAGEGTKGTVNYSLCMGGGILPQGGADGREGAAPTPPEPSLEPSTSSPQAEKTNAREEPLGFEDWLSFHSERSGHSIPVEGTKRRARLAAAWAAITADGFNPDDFLAASRACLTDWHRENGHDSFETVLRKTEFGAKVARGRKLLGQDGADQAARDKYDGLDGTPPAEGDLF